MAETLLWVALALVLLVVIGLAWTSHRRHKRRAEARSRAALNRLLAEADALEQSARQEDSEA